jgi:uncharacterized protein YjiS (DUF1127 family)
MPLVQLRSSREPLMALRPDLGRTHTLRQDWSSLASAAQRAVQILLIWRERARQRRLLQTLNDHMLRDIGLTRADVFAEASKPFWKP